VLSSGDPMKRPDPVELVEYGTDRGLVVSLTPSGTENLDREAVEDLPAIRGRVADLGTVLWSVFFLVPVGRGAILDEISPERSEEVM